MRCPPQPSQEYNETFECFFCFTVSKNNSIGSDSVKSDSDDYHVWSTPFNRLNGKIGGNGYQEWTSMTSSSVGTTGRRKYQPNGTGISQTGPATTVATTNAARRSQTMKVSKLMNGNGSRPHPPAPPPCHPGHVKQRLANNNNNKLFHDAHFDNPKTCRPPFNPSSSAHHLHEQSGHKAQTLNTRRGAPAANYSKSSALFRNSSVCNLERDGRLDRGMKYTKSGTVLLENRRKDTSSTSLWDVNCRNGNGKVGMSGNKMGLKSGTLNVSSNRRHAMHQSLHHLPSSTSCSSSESSPRNMMKHSSSLCHHLPPPDYSDSGTISNLLSEKE